MKIPSPLFLYKQPVTGLVPEQSSTAPTSPANGQLWTDTSVTPKVVRIWDGAVWAAANVYAGTTTGTFVDGALGERLANKNAASGYAGLDASSLLTFAQIPVGSSATTVARGDLVERLANKNAASGYAGVDASSRIAAAQLPSVITVAGTTGAATSIRFVGGSAAAPTTGTFAVGDTVVGADGSVYVCTVAGTPGTWRRSLRDNELGAANGIATLDGTTKVPIAQIPTGTTGSTVPFGNDSRFSDTRTPTANTITDAMVTAGAAIAESKLALASDAAAGTASRRTLGFTGTAAMPGTARLDQIAVPTAAVSMNTQRLTALAASAGPTDAVNRAELDAARQGYSGAKDPVRVVTTTNVTLATPGATLDGVTMAAGDRFLANAQTTALENGIYVWNGAAAAATRATDADTAGEVKDGTTVGIAAGTAAGGVYIQTAAVDTLAPGSTTAQTWVLYSTQATYTGTANRITVTGTQIDIAATYAGQTSIVTVGTVTAGTWNAGLIPVLYGGTGASTPAAARTNLGVPQVGYAATNDGAGGRPGALTGGTPITFTHNLGTQDVIAQVRDASTNEILYLDVINASTSTVTVNSGTGVNWALSSLRIVVLPVV